MKSKLTLIGAGPGDPELITIKGVKALQKADVVLYDALINKELLDFAPEALKVFVGKRAGNHAHKQEEINEMIVKYALEHGHVVRLKGGDPFVFGRGYEEIEYAASYGIATEVIPGISSSIAVPALQNIPLTLRGVSESYWVVSATTKRNEMSQDLFWAAQSTATVVILMGLGMINEIVELYKSFGKDKMPVAVIQNGTFPNERIITGEIQNIAELIVQEGIGSPAIIVVGEVVKAGLKFAAEKKEFGRSSQ